MSGTCELRFIKRYPNEGESSQFHGAVNSIKTRNACTETQDGVKNTVGVRTFQTPSPSLVLYGTARLRFLHCIPFCILRLTTFQNVLDIALENVIIQFSREVIKRKERERESVATMMEGGRETGSIENTCDLFDDR